MTTRSCDNRKVVIGIEDDYVSVRPSSAGAGLSRFRSYDVCGNCVDDIPKMVRGEGKGEKK